MHRRARLDGLLGLALLAALKSSREILKVYAGEFSIDLKEDHTPITEADRRAHRAIEGELSPSSPYPILSEEGLGISYAERKRWKTFWLVDPLDGTKEFIKRNGEFTINIALIARRRPILGVVYAPVLDLLYFAHAGIGSCKLEGFAGAPAAAARKGLEPKPEAMAAEVLRLAQRLPRRPSVFPGRIPAGRQKGRITVMRSRSHRSRQFDEYLRELERAYETVEIITIGSALKSCLVAEGRADLYPRFGTTMEWDTAAAQAVVNGVDRAMRAFGTGRELIYNKESLINPAFLVH